MDQQQEEVKAQSAPNRTGWIRVQAEAKHLLTIMDGTTKASASQRSDAHQQYYSLWDAAVIQTTDESRSEDLLPMLPQTPDQASNIALDEDMMYQLSRQMREELHCPFDRDNSKVAIERRQAWCASTTPLLLALYRLKYTNEAEDVPEQQLAQSVCSVVLGLTEGGWAGWVPESVMLWLLVTAEQVLLSDAVPSPVFWTVVWSRLLPEWFTSRWVSPDYPSIRAFHQRVMDTEQH